MDGLDDKLEGTARGAAGKPQAASGQAGDTAEQIRETVGDMAGQAQQAAGRAADQARDQVTSGITSQKDRAAEALSMVAQAVRQTGQELRSQDQAMFANYADRTAQAVEGVAEYVRVRDVGQMVGGLEQFARRNPMVFVGGSFALGLIAARFLKSSAPPSPGRTGYASSPTGYRPYGSTAATQGPRYADTALFGEPSAGSSRPMPSQGVTTPSPAEEQGAVTAGPTEFQRSEVDRAESETSRPQPSSGPTPGYRVTSTRTEGVGPERLES